MINKPDLLRGLELGSVVAEQDDLLSRCFVEHPVLSELVTDRKDVVLGAKGAGKSALWRELKDSKQRYPAIKDVHFHLITNPSGDPEFRDVLAALEAKSFPEADDLRVAWRLYFLSQFWRAAKPLIEASSQENWNYANINQEITRYGIDSEQPNNLKMAFAYAITKAYTLKNVKLKWKEGFELEFDEARLRAGGNVLSVPFNQIIKSIDDALKNEGKRVWLILDRLDEIVLGDEERENIVLKGLLLAFRDFSDFQNARVKIFLRDDVYNRVTSIGHFPALTHVRSKASAPIKWELEDLLHLLIRRLVANKSIIDVLQIENTENQTREERRSIYYKLFPEKVDKGRAAEGFKWIVDRITDGNGVATPRDLLSVIDAARQFQIEQVERDAIVLPGTQIFTEDTLRKSVRKVAKDNLETRIFAEYPDLRQSILAFEGGKADHNSETLEQILGEQYSSLLPRLQRVGFLYRRTRNGVQVWTIPFFYSFALDVTRGAAFNLEPEVGDEDDM